MRTAVICAQGFEEGEGLNIVDIMRRAGIECDIVGLDANDITGSHKITVKADKVLDDSIKEYDMIVLPGGLPGATNLRDSAALIGIIKDMYNNGKFVCAMCAAPIVLDRAGILDGKKYTAYTGYAAKMHNTGTFLEDIVVQDGNIITSRGPATVFEFAYKLVEVLGGDAAVLKEKMLYNFLLSSAK